MHSLNETPLPSTLFNENFALQLSTIGSLTSMHQEVISTTSPIALRSETFRLVKFLLRENIRKCTAIYLDGIKPLITLDSLRPGQTHRFSLRADYGLRSRESIVNQLKDILAGFSNNTPQVVAKEACPLIGLIGLGFRV